MVYNQGFCGVKNEVPRFYYLYSFETKKKYSLIFIGGRKRMKIAVSDKS
jgi:hypothetical protein